MCSSCASLLDDIQDETIIESAIPLEFDPPSRLKPEDQPQLEADRPKMKPLELSSHHSNQASF